MRDVVAGKNMSAAMRVLISPPADQRCRLAAAHTRGAVGAGVCLMIILNVTHPPAGGNPIIVIIGSVSIDYLINPIITGTIIILIFGIILNRLILKKKYPI